MYVEESLTGASSDGSLTRIVAITSLPVLSKGDEREASPRRSRGRADGNCSCITAPAHAL